MKNDYKVVSIVDDDDKKKIGIFGFIRGVLRVPVGLALGVTTLAVASVRTAARATTNAVLGIGGGIVTFAAGFLHVANFTAHKAVGSDTKDLSTKSLVTKAANFTGDRISGVLSAPHDVFSGKQDEYIKAKSELKDIPNTYSTLIKSIQLMMAMSPEERKKADVKAGRRVDDTTKGNGRHV